MSTLVICYLYDEFKFGLRRYSVTTKLNPTLSNSQESLSKLGARCVTFM